MILTFLLLNLLFEVMSREATADEMLSLTRKSLPFITREDALQTLQVISDTEARRSSYSTNEYYHINDEYKHIAKEIIAKIFLLEYSDGTIYNDKYGDHRIRCLIDNKYRVDFPWK